MILRFTPNDYILTKKIQERALRVGANCYHIHDRHNPDKVKIAEYQPHRGYWTTSVLTSKQVQEAKV